MTMTSMVVGAVTDTTATFVSKVTIGPNIRIKYSTDSGMAGASFSSSTAVDAQKVAKVSVTGLTAGTRYYWQVEDNGTVDTSTTGQFRTHPAAEGEAASFTFIASGDAGSNPISPDTTGATMGTATETAKRISNHPVFDTIRGLDPLFFVHLGDLHYYNLGSGSYGIVGGGTAANYRTAFDDVLRQSRQHQLYREVSWVYVWDDHDYGPNNSDGTFADKANAATVYRERVPHYTLAESSSIYHSFHVGRVLFVVSDTRYNRSPSTDTDSASKTMLGSAQKTWLDNLLATDTSEALIWLLPTPWLGNADDQWAGYTYERAELASLLTVRGWADRTLMLNADTHAGGVVTASGNSYGGFPIVLAGSLDATPSESTGTNYDGGFWPGRSQYATVQVDDNGTDICITATVWKDSVARTWASINTNGTTRIEAGGPSHVLAL